MEKQKIEKNIKDADTDSVPECEKSVSTSSTDGFTETEKRETDTKDKGRKFPWIGMSIFFVVIMLLLGSLVGYNQGIARRLSLEKNTIIEQATSQFELAYQDLIAGKYENARQRIEYVIQIYPEFPGAADLLKSILMQVKQPTLTPTLEFIVTPTPAVSVTPDLRSEEETFNTIKQQIFEKQWEQAIENVMAIRQNNFDYRRVDVDGLYYIALRNRGVQKIQSGELEQGLFDLSTAEQIAPLDGEADGIRTWATTYLTAASYWEVNWPQAIDLFYQVTQAYPYMMDSSGTTATERYRIALYRFGDQYYDSGNYCSALEYYKLSLGVRNDPDVQVYASQAANRCEQLTGETEVVQPTQPPPTTEIPPVVEETPTQETTP